MAALLEFLQEYVEQLGELTSPVKAKINSLTMLAAEEAAANPAGAPSIAAAIEKRINTVQNVSSARWCSKVWNIASMTAMLPAQVAGLWQRCSL
jgi:hypothetical protein